MNNTFKKIFIWLFAILYVCTGFVSTYHAVALFSLANTVGVAIVLAIVFEIGQAAVLFSILTSRENERHAIQWILMVILTTVQVIGNVFSTYRYMLLNNSDQLKYFTEPILFWTADPSPQAQNIILSYMIGAILPVVALCLTGLVANILNQKPNKESQETNIDDFKSLLNS